MSFETEPLARILCPTGSFRALDGLQLFKGPAGNPRVRRHEDAPRGYFLDLCDDLPLVARSVLGIGFRQLRVGDHYVARPARVAGKLDRISSNIPRQAVEYEWAEDHCPQRR